MHQRFARWRGCFVVVYFIRIVSLLWWLCADARKSIKVSLLPWPASSCSCVLHHFCRKTATNLTMLCSSNSVPLVTNECSR